MDQLLQRLNDDLGATYRIERELGGGMSRVFVATELALGRRVVLKVLSPELARDVSAERFKREISLAASLQHAHIVPLLTAGQAAGVSWFSMPFVEGQSLRERLTGGELPVPTAIRLLRDVAGALAYAHGRGIVHRDIKPENILISDGSAFVTDFGVSKAMAEAGAEHGATFTSVGVALGTPAYMSPEQIGAEQSMDHRADIYAFGVVAYEVLTGRNPFAGRSTQATMMAHMAEVPPPVEMLRSSTPPALAQLVARCLAKSPADRPQRAQEIVDALDALSTPTANAPMATRPMSTIGGVARWRWAAAALVVLLLSTGTFSIWRTSRGPALDARKVAVVPFQNLTGDSALGVVGRIAAEELSRIISQTDSADVVSSTAIDAALGNAGSAAIDAAQKVARATNAGIVVLGSYSRFADSLRVQVNIVDAWNGKVIRALDPAVGTVADPMTAISALRERLLGSLVSGDVASQVVLTSKAPKYSAYLEYMEGVKRFMQNQASAVPFAERAIELDSTLFGAYHLLATIHTNASRFDEAERVVDRLEAQRQQLSAYDRRRLEALRAANRYTSDEILPLLQDIYARSADPLYSYLIGFWGLRVLKADLALKALQIADSYQTGWGWVGQARDVAIAYHQLGNYRAELGALERGTRLVPAGASGYRNSRLRAFAGLGDSVAALALADTLLREQSDPNAIGAANAVNNGAREFEGHGDSLTAHRLQLKVLDWLRERRTDRPTLARQYATAQVWFDRGELDSATAYWQRAARGLGDTAVIVAGYLGVIAAQRGESIRARVVADSLGGQTRKWDRGLSTWWRAAILANLGERDAALQFLGESRRQGQSMAGWHNHPSLRPLRGYAPFEAMIKPQGRSPE